MKNSRQKLLVLVLCASTWAIPRAFAVEAWHPRLSTLMAESDLIVVGCVTKVSSQTRVNGYNQNSTVKVAAVLKGSKDLSSLRLLTYTDPDQTCPRTLGVEPQRSYILFLAQFDEKADTYSPTESRGTKPLPADPEAAKKILSVLERHIAYVERAETNVKDLRDIVLDELESETLFELGFSTLFYAQDENQQLLSSMNEDDQIRIFRAFKNRPFWYMDWANLAGILFHIDRRSPRLLKAIAQKLQRERDANGTFGSRTSSASGYFYAMCLLDASLEDDLGTGIPKTSAPFDHVRKWEGCSDAERDGIIKVFFDRLDAAMPGWQEKPKE